MDGWREGEEETRESVGRRVEGEEDQQRGEG